MTTVRPRTAGRPAGGGASRAAVAAVVCGVLMLVGCASAAPDGPADEVQPTATVAQAAAEPRASADPTVPVGSPPVGIRIATIDVSAPLIDLGIRDDGGMEVPEDFAEIGWFAGGGMPGGPGPTVIAAHVDSPTGPAAFIRLTDLVVGDLVEVVGADGVVAPYAVTETADYAKAEFPTARVFGATSQDVLRLITCGGVFDTSAASYLDNRVVYAERVA